MIMMTTTTTTMMIMIIIIRITHKNFVRCKVISDIQIGFLSWFLMFKNMTVALVIKIFPAIFANRILTTRVRHLSLFWANDKNADHIFTTWVYSIKTHFKIILVLMCRFPKWSLPHDLSINILHISYQPNKCYTSYSRQPHLFDVSEKQYRILRSSLCCFLRLFLSFSCIPLSNLFSSVIGHLLGKNGRELWIKSQAMSQHIKKF